MLNIREDFVAFLWKIRWYHLMVVRLLLAG